MNNTIIKTEKLSKIYKLTAEDVRAVWQVDLEIASGDFVAIMGPSGSGKTTLLDIIGCLDSISEGKLEILGHDLSDAKENNLVGLRRGDIGFVFQEFLLIPTLTAKENVELPLTFSRLRYEQDKSIRLLEKLGLGNRINHLPRELSGGERQRVAIARALITSPKILMADEPTGNLDTKNAEQIFEIFKQLNREDGLTIIVTTHNQKLGSQANRVVYLQDGRLVSREESSLYE